MKKNLRKGTVVYFQCNNWNPSPREASRFIYDYLEGKKWQMEFPKISDYTQKAIDWINENDLCINSDIYDMSSNYWVTTTKEWLEENFPELLEFAKEIPEDFYFVGDREFFLKYIPENCNGFNFINHTDTTPQEFEENKYKLIENDGNNQKES